MAISCSSFHPGQYQGPSANMIISLVLFALLLAGCSPGPSVYEGPLETKINIMLKEGKEYFVCLEDKDPDAWKFPGGGSSSWVSAGGYPILDEIVAVYDEMGNSIRNTISSGKLCAYYHLFLNYGRCGITVARFRLEGKGSRSIKVYVSLSAYRDFATSYNDRHAGFGSTGTGGTHMEAWAPREPYTITIREAGKMSSGTIIEAVFFVITIPGIAFLVYIIYRQLCKRKSISI